MNFQGFLEKYNGKKTDFDGWYGAQCMDLMHRYVYDVLGLTDKTVLAAPSAKDVYLNFENVGGSGYFEQIPNTPTGVPKERDIVFWGTKIGPYGHVAIFIEGDAKKFKSFDQNFPIGSPPHVQEHSYVGCLGWLRFKGSVPDLQGQITQTQEELRKYTGWFVGLCTALGVGASYDLALAEINKDTSLKDAIVQKDKQLSEATIQINDLDSKLSAFQKEKEILVEQMSKDKQEYESNLAARDKTIQSLDTEIKEAVVQIEGLKKFSQEQTLTGWRKWVHDWIVRI